MMQNVKQILDRINQAQYGTFVELERFRERSYIKMLPRKQRGLYWLWTNLSLEDLENDTKKPIRKEVPISQLVIQRKNLENICTIKHGEYQVVYNGIGGYKRLPASFGLRERINQEVLGNGPTVGTLNIFQKSDINRWAISYFNFDDEANREIVDLIGSENPYLKFGKDLEMLWRLEYGTPILSRH